MNPYAIGAICFVAGLAIGFMAASFCQAAHRSEAENNAMEAYYRGVRDGQASREIDLTDLGEKM